MTKIYCIGDTHDLRALSAIVKDLPEDGIIIQVGDLGFWSDLLHLYQGFGRNVYFVEGNHDQISLFQGVTIPTEFVKGLTYVPRGTVLTLSGKKVGFLGGATSVDRKFRPKNTGHHPWYPEEDITPGDAGRLIGNGPVDLMITHCPPASVVARNFDQVNFKSFFELPPDWTDPSAALVDWAWKQLGKPQLVCGHMHRSVVDDGVSILNINEVLTI